MSAKSWTIVVVTVGSVVMLLFSPINAMVEIHRTGVAVEDIPLALACLLMGAIPPFLLRAATSVSDRWPRQDDKPDDPLLVGILTMVVAGFVAAALVEGLERMVPPPNRPFVSIAFMASFLYNLIAVSLRLPFGASRDSDELP